ncbi:MAG TPA: CBS domain-containing protein [Thermoleophilia bacterium]|nr:CBS domain-containing protein [Thermoleophilia bacterium]HQG03716.1 CBS domain-containing protein [Thermoleophilia bacterium]HQG55302.1 CBS domain-containing protein [Thermoleophilia bacterium]HQJ98605.1 CBS domain-containing protein [Thermoleophilia bacterium]
MNESVEGTEGEPLVADYMVKDVITVPPDMGVKEFAELLRDKGIGGAPVVDEDGRLLGIVTEGDLMALGSDLRFPLYIQFLDSLIYLESAKKFEERLRKAVAATVADIMTEHVYTVRPGDPVRKVARLMSEHRFDRVPVVDGDKVVGIIGRHDVLEALGL